MRRFGSDCLRVMAMLALATLAHIAPAALDRGFAADDPPRQPSAMNLTIVAEDASLQIQLKWNIGDEPLAARFEQSRRHYIESLFARLDRDSDGRLTEAEAAPAPSPQLALPDSLPAGEADSVHVAFNFRAVDLDRDGHATLEELVEFYSYFGDGPFRLRILPASAGRLALLHEALLSKLDRNGDGTVEISELEAATDLAALDRDGDEVLSASDLLPPGSADGIREPANTAGRFGLRRSPSDTSRDVTLVVTFPSDSHAGDPVLMYYGPKLPVSAAGTLRLTHAGLNVDIEVVPPPLRTLERTRRVLTLEFDGADADGNGRIARDDRLAGFLTGAFEVLDSDGDGSVTSSDVQEYANVLLPAEDAFLGSQITLTLKESGRGLFALLDANGDGRLGLRELQSAPAVGGTCDRNGDGRLQFEEMTPSHRLVIERGTLRVPYAAGTLPAPGPAWFSRMDRNRDGDVSRGEFLGGGRQFEQLDFDRDGWIGLEEALQVERRSSGDDDGGN